MPVSRKHTHVDFVGFFGLLDHGAVCSHAFLGEGLGEGGGDEGDLVQAGEGDEL